MCNQCNNGHEPIDIEDEIALYREKLELLVDMHSCIPAMTEKDQKFATDLYAGYQRQGGLSPKQWHWVGVLRDRVSEVEPIYGSFNAILVMFRLAAANGGLKRPKIRLMSHEGRFVQLNFDPEETNRVKVFVDGWQGHGIRKYAGERSDDMIKPYTSDRMTPDVKAIIQELALDPAKTARAMAAKLSACMYCGQRLSDAPSKEVGYGPVCAANYELPWGGRDNKQIDLGNLF